MIPFLNPLKESIWLRITILAVASGFCGIIVWILISELLPVSIIYSYLTAGTVIIALSVVVGKSISNYAMQATDFLTKAILLATNQENQVETPNAELLGSSKEFLSRLAESIYNLSNINDNSDEDTVTNLLFFRTLANSIPLPIIVLNNEQTIIFVNNATLNYIGCTAKDIMNKSLFEALDLSFVSKKTLESWIKQQAEGSITDTEVWERVRLDLPNKNERKHFDLAAHFSKDDSNRIETVLVLFDRTLKYERDDHDLTFISLAVHELRTPLTIMRGYIEVFEDELSNNLNQEQTTFMHNMGASAQRLTSFVTNILNVARVEENALFLKLKEEDWEPTLLTACKDMELRANVYNKKIVYNIADNLPTVAVDKVSIYEVVSNIIDNAVKYTHTDEVITVSAYEKDGMVETTINDKGVGIPENLIDHIFDKFYRTHKSKNSVGGTGLGLFLCRSIISAHDGHIWVKSKEDEGSTFGFSLPIYKNVASQNKTEDNESIVRGAHGWIKNHSIYRE